MNDNDTRRLLAPLAADTPPAVRDLATSVMADIRARSTSIEPDGTRSLTIAALFAGMAAVASLGLVVTVSPTSDNPLADVVSSSSVVPW